MKIVILLFALIPTIVFSQTIISDKKDPFTNVRTITTGLNTLYKTAMTPILQVQSRIEITDDSVSSYMLNFITPALNIIVNSTDTIANSCLLKDESGNIFTSTMNKEIEGAVLHTAYQAYSCTFNKEDFYKIIPLKITDIKITTNSGKGGLFQVDKRSQDNIAKQAKALLQEYKTYLIK